MPVLRNRRRPHRPIAILGVACGDGTEDPAQRALLHCGSNHCSTTTKGENVMSHERYESCIEACHDCAVACEHCATECLKESDVKMMARCIALDRSCADICALAEREMARASE